jgi:hypothetical protein
LLFYCVYDILEVREGRKPEEERMNGNKKVCTCECCTGDYVYLARTNGVGLEGMIVDESNETFTILLSSGQKVLIDAKVIYENVAERDLWEDEETRKAILDAR